MKRVLFIFFCLSALVSFAQQQIKIEDAKQHIGDSVKICGRIYGGKYMPNVKGQPTLLDMGGNYPNAAITVVIWNEIRTQFDKAPEVLYKDVQVCLTGKIELYKGRPQIVLRSKNQVLSALKDEEVIEKK